MRKIMILTAAVCLLAACGKDSNEELLTTFFFENGEDINWDNISISQGLVAYWAFEGTTTDSSANGIHATIKGNIGSTTGHKPGTLCATFDGNANNYMYVSNTEKLKLDIWTINLWYKCTDEAYRAGGLLSRGRSNEVGSFELTPNTIYIINPSDAQYGTLYQTDTSLYPSFNTWHMLTVQMIGNNLTMYLDGEFMWSDYISANYVNRVNQYLYFGVSHWYGYFNHPFKGCIDDVRIYDRILSAEEVKYLYSI